jgi:hypothetical protein
LAGFFTGHSILIGSVLRKCGVHKSDVEDLRQQVWVIVLARLPTWVYDPGVGTLGGYIGKIAGRVARKHLRRQLARLDRALTTELESRLLDLGPGPSSECDIYLPLFGATPRRPFFWRAASPGCPMCQPRRAQGGLSVRTRAVPCEKGRFALTRMSTFRFET